MTSLPPDIAALLAVLSGNNAASGTPSTQAGTPIPDATQTPTSQPASQEKEHGEIVEEEEYVPPDIDYGLLASITQSLPAPPPPSTTPLTSLPQHPQPQPIPPPPLPTSTPATAPPPPPPAPAPPPKPKCPDPSTITAWPPALKHLLAHLAPHPAILTKIRALVAEQARHERQWAAQRREIVAKHARRAESSRDVREILSSLAGGAGGEAAAVEVPSREEEEGELRAFERKVYAASVKMCEAFEADLRNLGVPFYCGGAGGRTKEEGGAMEAEELLRLRRKVLEMLEDLVAEDG